jgi:putative phage-type endonuclease
MRNDDPIVVNYATQDEWLNLRAADLTSSEVAALFGHSPYTTRLELWLSKRGGQQLGIAETERMFWGNQLEAPIADGLAAMYGLTVEPLKVYMRHPTVERMGSSFDFRVVACDPDRAWEQHRETAERIAALLAEHGWGLFEIKNVDSLMAHRTWDRDGDMIEAPLHIELQVQHQLAVSQRGFALIGALTGGNTTILEIRERDDEAVEAIEAGVVEFWRTVDADEQPSPDYERDLAAIRGLYEPDPDAELEEEQEQALLGLLPEYDEVGEQIRELEKRKKALQARLFDSLRTVEKAEVGEFRISAKTVNRKGYTVEPRSYRDLRITRRKSAGDDAKAAA